ncbi:hypothetical protein BC938DRAFT_470998 [Jimgerdemannia flammicorona]|uniref:Uncharacterized protein n=1 Tax=Jimgerdemannia flammicorona TaxID=994334 RepID=A0A433Q934_9FUNG|nr:hypothetical protein BC938DRAFT_470998 [Jimgerdemannia flammicorona]
MSSLGDFIKNLREKLHKPARGVSVRRSRSTRNIFTAYTAPFPELGTTLSAGSLTMKIPSFGGTEGDSVRSANGTVYAEPEPSFVWVDGRRFHNVKESPYILPNDDIEQDRLVHQHYMIKEAFGRNYQAPVKNLLEDGAKILDMGCVI